MWFKCKINIVRLFRIWYFKYYLHTFSLDRQGRSTRVKLICMAASVTIRYVILPFPKLKTVKNSTTKKEPSFNEGHRCQIYTHELIIWIWKWRFQLDYRWFFFFFKIFWMISSRNFQNYQHYNLDVSNKCINWNLKFSFHQQSI